MGIIQRQGIKGSIVNYLGILLGIFSTLFIYPLDWNTFGEIQYWIASATLLTPILRLGSTSLINKYYPYFQEKRIQGFLKFIIVVTLSTVMIMSLVLFGIQQLVVQFSLFTKADLFYDSFWIIYGIALLMIFVNVLQQQIWNYHRIVIPEILVSFSLKVFIPIAVILVFTGYLNESNLFCLFALYYAFVIVSLFTYANRVEALDLAGKPFKYIKGTLKKGIFQYWLFGGANSFGLIIAYKIDLVMIGSMLNKVLVGHYGMFLFMANILEIPFKSINRISVPIISSAFERDDIEGVTDIYKKGARNLLVISLFVFSIIWINLDHLFVLMTNGEDIRGYKSVFLWLGLAKLVDSATSVNNLILIYSKWYRYNLVFLFVLGVVNITFNYLFIDMYGVVGAAYATFISVCLFNLIKLLFIYIKMGIHPFSPRLYALAPILILTFILGKYTFLTFNPLIVMPISSILFALFYCYYAFKLRVSEEVNTVLSNVMRKYFF